MSGVWDGYFDKGDFSHAHFACCTGAVLTNVNRERSNFQHSLASA